MEQFFDVVFAIAREVGRFFHADIDRHDDFVAPFHESVRVSMFFCIVEVIGEEKTLGIGCELFAPSMPPQTFFLFKGVEFNIGAMVEHHRLAIFVDEF